MASDKKKVYTDYKKLVSELKRGGPKPLYLLWGEEDYLCGKYFDEVKHLCFGENETQFNYRRLDGSQLDLHELSEALESMPFMGERSLVEVHGFEINSFKTEKTELLSEIICDIPDYATAVFILPSGYVPDGRLKAVKDFKKYGEYIEFTTQPAGPLMNWIKKRFNAYGKVIGSEECERLIFLSGERMTSLISEIDKIASFSESKSIEIETVDKLAHHVPEAKVFKMTDAIATRDFDSSADYLSELIDSGEPMIKTLAVIGSQMRRLYAARLAIDKKLSAEYVMEVCKIKYRSHADNVLRQAQGFSRDRLKNIVAMCTQFDYRMKSSTEDDENLLIELFLKIAAGEKNDSCR